MNFDQPQVTNNLVLLYAILHELMPLHLELCIAYLVCSMVSKILSDNHFIITYL